MQIPIPYFQDVARSDFIFYRNFSDDVLRALYDGACVVISMTPIAQQGLATLEGSFQHAELVEELFWRKWYDCLRLKLPADPTDQSDSWHDVKNRSSLRNIVPYAETMGDSPKSSQLLLVLKHMLSDAKHKLKEELDKDERQIAEQETTSLGMYKLAQEYKETLMKDHDIKPHDMV